MRAGDMKDQATADAAAGAADPSGRARPRPRPWPWSVALLATLAATALLAWRTRAALGADLFPLWMAGRFHAQGMDDLLYVLESAADTVVRQADWLAAAAEAGYRGLVLGYVMPPVWAILVSPLAEALDWAQFKTVFAWLNCGAVAAATWLAVDIWAPPGGRAKLMTGAALMMALSLPTLMVVVFNQPQGFVALALLAALRDGERGRPARAGLFLALAASAKLTPAGFGLWWLLTGNRAAAGWALAWGAILLALCWAVAGTALMADFAANALTMASAPATAPNNQSLANALAWLADRAGMGDSVPVARAATILGLAGGLGLAVAAARRQGATAGTRLARGAPAALLGLVLAPAVAWAHYFLFLAPLALSLPGRLRGGRPAALLALAGLAFGGLTFFLRPALYLAFPFLTTAAALLVAAMLVWAPDRDRGG